MRDHSSTGGKMPRWSVAGFAHGARQTVVLMPGTALFGITFGALAAQKEISLLDSTIMSAVVFAGSAQLVVMEVWPQALTFGAIVSIMVICGVMNMRHVLMGASLRPWLGPAPASKVYPTLLTMNDASWIIAMRHRAEGGSDAGVLLGAGIGVWAVWVPSTSLGHLLGSVFPNPKLLALDLLIPTFFAAMTVPMWRGARRAVPWVVAGATALAVEFIVPGWWFIVIGALAGAVTGGYVNDRE